MPLVALTFLLLSPQISGLASLNGTLDDSVGYPESLASHGLVLFRRYRDRLP
jgi:hypothetical protein